MRNESGQSTLEFALVLIFLMGFVLFFLQLALVLAYGNYAHYATFMAARAHMAAGPDEEDQVQRSKDVIVRMLKKSAGQPGIDRWPLIAEGIGDGEVKGADASKPSYYQKGDSSLSWLEGVRYKFRSRIFLLPLGGDADVNSVTLTSESWLGREPTYRECVQYLSDKVATTLVIDNGC